MVQKTQTVVAKGEQFGGQQGIEKATAKCVHGNDEAVGIVLNKRQTYPQPPAY